MPRRWPVPALRLISPGIESGAAVLLRAAGVSRAESEAARDSRDNLIPIAGIGIRPASERFLRTGRPGFMIARAPKRRSAGRNWEWEIRRSKDKTIGTGERRVLGVGIGCGDTERTDFVETPHSGILRFFWKKLCRKLNS